MLSVAEMGAFPIQKHPVPSATRRPTVPRTVPRTVPLFGRTLPHYVAPGLPNILIQDYQGGGRTLPEIRGSLLVLSGFERTLVSPGSILFKGPGTRFKNGRIGFVGQFHGLFKAIQPCVLFGYANPRSIRGEIIFRVAEFLNVGG